MLDKIKRLIVNYFVHVLAIFAWFPAYASADDFLCFTEGAMYTAKAPKQWKLDNESGKSNGLCLVGYPENGSWGQSETVIYINVTPKGHGSRDVSDVMKYDAQRFLKISPKVKITVGRTFVSEGKKVKSQYFLGSLKPGSFEAVGYLDQPKSIVLFVMSSKTEAGLQKNLDTFGEFIESFRFIANYDSSKSKSTRK